MKSECLLRDEKCDFVMRRTVRATVLIVRILFDRFSMMVKPERSTCEKIPPTGLADDSQSGNASDSVVGYRMSATFSTGLGHNEIRMLTA